MSPKWTPSSSILISRRWLRVVVVPGLAGGRAKGTNSEGGGVERSKAAAIEIPKA